MDFPQKYSIRGIINTDSQIPKHSPSAEGSRCGASDYVVGGRICGTHDSRRAVAGAAKTSWKFRGRHT